MARKQRTSTLPAPYLKRLWLATHRLTDRPPRFRTPTSSHWTERRSVSRLTTVDRPA